ncbi:uncharacterized protein K452DRAFT_291302 [Aplosporella prunicola CBS 121167]|uniref:Uncharacterized protein n=1 Tax=Aplosporella prunicola CBS 121167 TaxID=1176127 RepID=A0A6A6B1K3_9PEZI|nr:uncharacterized protein K452DRAFT_291302 [Aplosporella prunicola CBS 121167]KAF2137696.1 hypothetical protein K452DRAFT_291302 [Aplosporella prunicola CBS 121167]
MLLDKGADVNAQNRGYGNTLQAASHRGREKIGADVKGQGGEYGNTLQAAYSLGHEKIVQMLLDKGADVNAQGGEYGNALQATYSRGYEKIVQILQNMAENLVEKIGRVAVIEKAAKRSSSQAEISRDNREIVAKKPKVANVSSLNT